MAIATKAKPQYGCTGLATHLNLESCAIFSDQASYREGKKPAWTLWDNSNAQRGLCELHSLISKPSHVF